MSTKLYAEAGIGNQTFLSTEYESESGDEYRRNGFRFAQFQSMYLRAWVGKRIFILDSKEGFKTKKKSRKAFKLLFGIASVE